MSDAHNDASGCSPMMTSLSTEAINKTVTVETITGLRVVGRCSALDGATMNVKIDFLREVGQLVAGVNGAAVVPPAMKFLKSIFIRGSSIRTIEVAAM